MQNTLGANNVHDLIGLFEGWEKVQELSEHLSGVKAQLVDAQGNFISGREALPLFCRLVLSSKIGETRCRQCYESHSLSKTAVAKKHVIFKCHAGLENIVFPLAIEGNPAGAIACGRGLNPRTRPDDRGFQTLAEELGVKFEEMELAVGGLATIDTAELSSHAKVLQPFTDLMAGTIFRYFNLIEKSEELIVAAKQSEAMSSLDRLTGLFNRRYFDSRLASEVSRAARYHHPLALILMELDEFDSRTDAYGLMLKDIVLKEAADEMLKTARQAEVVARFDDDRFVVIMPECDHEQAFRLAERIRKSIAVRPFGKDSGLDIQLSMSFGISAMGKDIDADQLVERAEQVLAQAKSDGGNKIRINPMQGVVPQGVNTPHIFIPSTAKKRRVVITGMGLVTPNGVGKDAFWEAMKHGKRALGPISLFDASKLHSQIAAEVVNFDPSDFMSARDARRMDRFAQFAVAASRMAVEDANLKDHDATRMGVRLGTNVGGIGFAEDQHSLLIEKGPRYISPFLAIAFSIGSSSSQISLAVGAKGTSLTIGGECTSGASAIACAYDEIINNKAEIMLAGGAEAPIRPIFMSALDAIRLLSTRNEDPKKACRPFDLERDGLVIGEGAALFVLEEMDHAIKRNASIYGEMLGYGMTCDAFHMVQPDPEGTAAVQAIMNALEASGLRPNDIDYVNAHGSSTQLNDAVETRIIKIAFGDSAKNLPVSGTKSMTGHAIGAVAAIEFATTTLAIRDGYLPPTMNYEVPDPDCDLDYVPNRGRSQEIDYAISNSFGFGGKNAILTLAKFQEK